MEDVLRFVTAPIWHCTGTRESLLTASPIIFMDLMPQIFWLIRSFICFGRFVISVGWGRRIDIYLVSRKWPVSFPHNLILYQHNSPDGFHKMVDCHDPFLPPGTLAFIAVHSISILNLLQRSTLLRHVGVLFGVVYSSIPFRQSIIPSFTRAFVLARKEKLSFVGKDTINAWLWDHRIIHISFLFKISPPSLVNSVLNVQGTLIYSLCFSVQIFNMKYKTDPTLLAVAL